ncbi:hypothetical protein BC826DRAFT_1073355 [Russula brevipes]|nr:hypothetical protein BC826DRAFT_1075358 [Russula brevipes]KAI0280868.1 hypothetical protein BC826DRAFT_1073355 [Russula brevipes]
MRFGSTLVITFLVPILDILASVGAAPSGLQPRTLPIALDFAYPAPGQVVHHSDVFMALFGIQVNHKHCNHVGPTLPMNWSVEMANRSIDLGPWPLTVSNPEESIYFYPLPSDTPAGQAMLRYQYVVCSQTWSDYSQPFTMA